MLAEDWRRKPRPALVRLCVGTILAAQIAAAGSIPWSFPLEPASVPAASAIPEEFIIAVQW